MKKIILILVSVLIVGIITSIGVTHVTYMKNFPRFDRPLEDEHAYLTESHIGDYPREEVSFVSGDNTLQGYLYQRGDAKALVVIVHGLGGGADSYLSHMKWFYDEGFSVFMFDATGTYDSEGSSTLGFPQIIIDLEHALDYVSSHEELKTLDFLLFGHSWGGYAVLNSPHVSDKVQAIVSVSAPASANDMIGEQIDKSMGIFSELLKPMNVLYQSLRFSSYAKYDGIKAINEYNIPTMLIHSRVDKLVGIDASAAVNRQEEITSDKVQILILENIARTHNHILKSEAALDYVDTLNEEYRQVFDTYDGEVPEEIRTEFYQSVDRYLAQELDASIMGKILAFYLNVLEEKNNE